MAGVKRKVLGGLIAVDALVAAGIWFNIISLLNLQEWLWLNVLAAAISLTIFFSTIKLRRRQAEHHRKYRGKNGETHSSSYSGPRLTTRGESVKSGGEMLIADYLHAHNIKYEYEKPANDSSNRRISRPDFYLPEYHIYVEYWGMVNAKERQKRIEYTKGMKWKKARYRESGLRVISVYPEDLGDLDSIFSAQLRK